MMSYFLHGLAGPWSVVMILRPPTLAYPGLLQKRVLTIRESWKLSKELRHSHECPWIFQPHSTTRGDLDDFMRLCTLQIHRQLWLIFPCGQTLCRCECMICHYIVKKSFVGNLRFNAVRWRPCHLPIVFSYDLQFTSTRRNPYISSVCLLGSVLASVSFGYHYPLVNWHNCGKSPISMGTSTIFHYINGHFQYLCNSHFQRVRSTFLTWLPVPCTQHYPDGNKDRWGNSPRYGNYDSETTVG